MRAIGLHLRIFSTLVDVAHQATQLNLPIFQCFLLEQESKQYIQMSDEQIKAFMVRRQNFADLYVHGSYWINLAKKSDMTEYLLRREIELAKRLGFTHIIFHPGAIDSSDDRIKGIDTIARLLNKFVKHEETITFVLENVAYQVNALGGDLMDFRILREKLDAPEKVTFCIDTAHAFAFGYDIVSRSGYDYFIDLLNAAIGFENIAIIHLNDTKEECGSYQDRHDILGHGSIGIDALKRLVLDKRLASVPLIMEIPLIAEQEKETILTMVRSWHTTE